METSRRITRGEFEVDFSKSACSSATEMTGGIFGRAGISGQIGGGDYELSDNAGEELWIEIQRCGGLGIYRGCYRPRVACRMETCLHGKACWTFMVFDGSCT